jgi:cellulose synthase operon protein C
VTTGAKTAAALSIGFAVFLAGCSVGSNGDSVSAAKKHLAKLDYVAALIELKSALQRTPDSGEARFLLGSVLLQQGDIDGAVIELTRAKALQFDPDRVTARLAHAVVLTGKAKETVDAYSGVELAAPEARAELATALALAYSRLGRRPEADSALDRALSADPSFPWALLTKARVLVGKGRFDEALATAERARAPGAPNGEIDLFKGMVLEAARRQPEEIVRAYEAAAADPTQTIRARTYLIEHYIRKGALPEARKQLASLRKQHPLVPQTLYADAVLSYEERSFARTEEIVNALLKVAPDDPRLLVLGGAANLGTGALTAAEAKLGRVVRTKSEAPAARHLLAQTYIRMGQGAKALATLKPLLDRPSPSRDSLVLAASAHLLDGEAAQAEALFNAAAAQRPNDVKVQMALAMIDLARGQASEAFDTLRSIASTDPGDAADLAAITSRLRRREFDEALAAIALLQRKQPGKPSAAYLRGFALRGKGDLQGARAAFDEALKAEPRHQASMLALSALDRADGKLEEARKRLSIWIETHPKDVPPRIALLDIRLQQMAPPEELLAGIDDAIRAAPTDPAPRLAKIVQLARVNDIRGALLAAQTALAALPNDPLVLDAAGGAYMAAGQEQQAIATFNNLARAAPGSALPFLRLASVYRRLGNVAAAEGALGRAFEVEPLSNEVHQQLLAQAARSKNFKQVMAAADGLQRRHPQQSVGFELEGAVWAAQGRWSAAAKAYRTALTKGGGTKTATRAFDSLSSSAGRKAADDFATEWLTKHPSDAAFYAFLGDRARQAKELPASERYYQMSLKFQPDHGGVLNNLAWVLGEMGRIESAIGHARKAVSLYPKTATFLDTLAGLLVAGGQIESAIDWQRRALDLQKGDGRMTLSLAEMLIKVGRKEEAKALLADLRPGKGGQPSAQDVSRLVKLASS